MKRALFTLALSATLLSQTSQRQLLVSHNIASGGGSCSASVSILNSLAVTRYVGPSFTDTVNYVASTDANTAFVLLLAWDGSGASITSCTYGGATMTSAGTAAHDATNNLNASIYYLMNPATGSQTMACTGTSVGEYYLGHVTFQNVNASTPIRASSYTTNNSTSITISSNTQDISVTAIEASSSTTSSDQTYVNTNAGTYSAGMDSATTPAASKTHTWTASGTMALAGASMMCK